MSRVDELEEAIKTLTDDELAAFRQWFAEYDAQVWDRQIEMDVASGKLENLKEKALASLRSGDTREI